MKKKPPVVDRVAKVVSPTNRMVRTILVDDPYASRDPEQKSERIRVAVSLRDDKLAYLRAKRKINEAQFQAGKRWLALYEKTQLGSMKGFDPTRERVQTSGPMAEVSESKLDALAKMREVRERVGVAGEVLLRRVIVERTSFAQLAEESGEARLPSGKPNWRADKRFLGHFRGVLDLLAGHWGVVASGPEPIRSKMRSWRK